GESLSQQKLHIFRLPLFNTCLVIIIFQICNGVYFLFVKISKAMRELIRCVALSRLVYGDGHWRFAEAIAKLAFGYLLQGLHFQAKQHAESARNIMLTGVHLPESQTEKGKVLEALLTTYYSLEAHQNLLKAENILDELQSLRGMQHLPIMITEKDVNLSLGRVAILQNKPASAITFFEKAATYVKACKGEDSLELIIIYQEMGKAEQMRARHEEAVEHLLHCLLLPGPYTLAKPAAACTG
uniref:Tetratricopeptide repeat domain 23 like n=1 Tax=Erpetoichthys calabaricus TaxID=27687 RepID=A0A8C4RMP5_ERPCA